MGVRPTVDLDYNAKLLPPTFVRSEESDQVHIFGTDKLGRDIFRRVVHGGWNSLRVGIIAVSISLSIGGILGLLAGFFESTHLNGVEQAVLTSLLGLGCGALPAWIANQPFQALLFMLLGIGSALFSTFMAQSPNIRKVLFGVIGMAIGGLLGLLVAPLVGLVCAVVGLGIGIILAKPISGKAFSSFTMRVMDIILSFPSYLLAIAIVAFLGPGLEKGMLAIGFVGIPVYARLARSAVLSVSQKEYVLASQSLENRMGAFYFVTPNILSPIIVRHMGLADAISLRQRLASVGAVALYPNGEQC